MRSQCSTSSLISHVAVGALLLCTVTCRMNEATAEEKLSPPSLTLLVMDPLSSPLACDCVQGYAQREYEALGAYLQRSLQKPVKVVWSESIASATKEHGTPHIIIGKHSVVKSKTKQAKQRVRPIAQLSGLDGKVTQTGLIVVRKQDSARSLSDLNGYRILFGPEDCEEKHSAPMKLLKENGIEIPAKPETSTACSEAAAALMEIPASVNAAAVISSYAKPLLAGCGTIKKGDLRVIGESETVPFITAFASLSLPQAERQAIRTALLDVELEPQLMVALESAEGFKRWVGNEKKKPADSHGKDSEAKTASKKK